MLHRDIFWLGKQWAVTGYGIQAISNKFEMKFDVEASRIWEDQPDPSLGSQPWFNADDFAEALAIARKRSRESPDTFRPPNSGER